METQKIVNILSDPDNEYSKFVTRKWYIVNDQNDGQYGRGNENDSTIKFETKVIKPSLCDRRYKNCRYCWQMLVLHLKIVLLLQDM